MTAKELRQKWLNALRSGRYQQGRRHLRKDGRYCCLGVLCDVSGVGKWRYNERFSCFSYGGDTPYNNATATVPELVREAVGLRDEGGGAGNAVGSKVYSGLIWLNDNRELSFEEIADILEQNPELYFEEG